jgi:hypothetical protein
VLGRQRPVKGVEQVLPGEVHFLVLSS